jgi:hypothetical protein
MKTPPIVTTQEWEAARQQLLVKEKELTRARDALAAERRRMPWLAVEKDYEFGGPEATASLLDSESTEGVDKPALTRQQATAIDASRRAEPRSHRGSELATAPHSFA